MFEDFTREEIEQLATSRMLDICKALERMDSYVIYVYRVRALPDSAGYDVTAMIELVFDSLMFKERVLADRLTEEVKGILRTAAIDGLVESIVKALLWKKRWTAIVLGEKVSDTMRAEIEADVRSRLIVKEAE